MPSHVGLHATQRPLPSQTFPSPQPPQEPPHPSFPHTRPAQLGTHAATHCPVALQ